VIGQAGMAETQFRHSIGLLIWMVITQVGAITSLIFWLFLITSPDMIFAGESGSTVFLLLFFLYPIFPISMIISAWVSYFSDNKWLAAILSSLSIAPNVFLILA
jgi:hypothetical protein